MGTAKVECQHRCRNTCEMLSDAMMRERKLIAHFETMISDCRDPHIRDFAGELAKEHTQLLTRIGQKLSEIKVNAEVLDDIIESFDP